MPAASPTDDLAYYHYLRGLDLARPAVQQAIAFSRVWADLTNRLLAARSVKLDTPSPVPYGLALPALVSFLDDGPGFTAQAFARRLSVALTADEQQLLGATASWLSGEFDPADPAATSLQVWLEAAAPQRITLYGRPRPSQPPPPLVLAEAPPASSWLREHAARPIALLAHYDVHGLAMLALTLRYARQLGCTDIDCIFSFEQTGDIGKLWKRTLPRVIASERDYAAVFMIDCSVDSRRPNRTLKALSGLDDKPNLRLVIIDHHNDTFSLAAPMCRPNLELVLADVFSCGLTQAWDAPQRQLMVLGALGDKVPEVYRAYPPQSWPDLHAASEAFHRRLIQFSPTPKELSDQGIQPLQPLWEKLAAAEVVTVQMAADSLGPLPPSPPLPMPEHVVCGSLVIVTQRIDAVGRMWYALLESLMEHCQTSYAAALRVLDNKRANVLLLTRWLSTHLPPVRSFIPEQFLPDCLGHPAAQWVDLEKSQAILLVSEVAERLNDYCGTPASIEFAVNELMRNQISPPSPSHNDI